MITKNKRHYGKGIQLCCFIVAFLLIALPAQAIQWTYYDIGNNALQNPTQEEIESTAVMRVSDTGVTQYILEIDHDFSGTWGTGYFDNIGNPSPGVGKQWVNINEEVTCKVDGIVQDVYNMNSRYIATGYMAQGPPNIKDNADALIFDGKDDYVSTENVTIKYPSSIIIYLSAKRDRTNVNERLFANKYGIYAGFTSDNKAIFGTYSESCISDDTTGTGWHDWKFKLKFFTVEYHDTTGQGYKLWIYKDGIQIAYKKIEPRCWTNEHTYIEEKPEKGCYIPGSSKIGENDEPDNSGWKQCQEEWGTSDFLDSCSYNFGGLGSVCGHPIQICEDYQANAPQYCDQCYVRGEEFKSESYCKSYWYGKGLYNYARGDGSTILRTNVWTYEDLMISRTVEVENSYNTYHAQWKSYYLTQPIYIGRSYTDKYFQGKIKNVKIYQSGSQVGSWKLNDGNKSSIAKDSWSKDIHGTLNNFDTDKCWLVNPKLKKKYDYDQLQERQTVPVFTMTSPGKIVYDWGRQHAVSVNSFPENLNDNISVQVIGDDNQDNNIGAGKYWYNHNSNIVISANEGACQKLSGYRDNVADPNILISSNQKVIVELTTPENFSWVYSPYIFEETVTIGSPVVLSTVPPDLIKNIDLSQKPTFISTDASETDICYWNDTDKRIYPLRAETSFDLEYDLLDSVCDGIKVILRVKTIWPESPHVIHVAKTPPVDLDPKVDDDVAFIDIKHVESDATVGDNKFSATQKGRAILHFKRNYIDNTIPKEVSLSFDRKGFAETEKPIELSDSFTIEFYAKRQKNNSVDIAIGHGRPKTRRGLLIGFASFNKFIFNFYGDYLKTPIVYKDLKWHHWACVYETDISEIAEDAEDSYIDTELFTCNNPSSNKCKFGDSRCYTKEFVGDYAVKNGQRYWNHMAKARRQCGVNIKYIRKIYCDGELVASKESDKPYKGQGKIRLGRTGEGWSSNWGKYQGLLDEVRIWNTARTQQQIKSNMNKSLSGDEDQLLAYFPMDRIGSPYLEDGRINSNDTRIAILKDLDPSNSWIVDTNKLFALDPTQISAMGHSCVRVVETRLESENKQKGAAIIGHEILGAGFHDSRVPHNGYVFHQNVPHNMDIYDRETLQGSIYPVNTRNPNPSGRDRILVIWYRMQDSVSWPYQPTEYESSWPWNGNRIVIASRMGSEGKNPAGKDQVFNDINNEPKNYFDPARYQDLKIYNQPDPLIPGYNPNEEHAVIAGSYRHSSTAPRPLAAFALRYDLNIKSEANFTSRNFVLVQYFDTVLQRHGMAPFQVRSYISSCGYYFNYLIKAGDPVVAPYPLNEVIGATPPAEIFGKNGNSNQNCYWKDHKGQSWAISGGGQSIEIASASVANTTSKAVDYVLNLQSDTMIYGDRYLIKVNDDRGFMGMMYFTVGSADNVQSKSAVYVDGNSISVLGGTNFTVTLRQGVDNLSANHFKLYHFEKDAYITVNYWYPLQPSFWWDSETPGDGTGNVGLSIPWLPSGTISKNDNFPEDMLGRPKARTIRYDAIWPEDLPVLKAGETLTFPGGEYRSDNTNAPGLPGALGWATGQLLYDTLNPTMESDPLFKHYLVRVVPGLLERKVPLSLADFPEDLQPASKRVNVIMNKWYFKELHAGIKNRIYYDPTTEMLCMKGFINDKTLGDKTLTASPPSIYVLQPNILTDREKNTIKTIEGANEKFKNAVDTLYVLSKNPNQFEDRTYTVGLELYKDCVTRMISDHPKKEKYINDMFYAWLGNDIADDDNRVIPKVSYGPGLSVVPNGALLDPNDTTFNNFTSGYITLVENNHPDMAALPVSLHIVKVVKEKIRGAIKTVYSDNVFDEKITLRHSADFGAKPNDLIFQWWYREEDGTDQLTPDIIPDKWLIFPDPEGNDGVGMSEISLSGAGAVLLVDNQFFVRYRHKFSDPDDPTSWSQWAGAANSRPEKYIPQLAEGWVKRVLNGINPFEARISSFYNTDSPATYVSMIRQLGPRYEGPVAFNPAKDVIENVGLIELYQTVLNRAADLSINLEQPASTPGITTALLLAATRISSFYNLLGNDAYNDALDPTIGFGTDSEIYGSLAPTIFTFMNQTPDLLNEEITLLCGRLEKGARPAYNRFLWNFTKGQGEAAYALSYHMDDFNYDGFIDEADGRILYPQGHGDAWGHYLTALKQHYDLLSHPQFNWISRSEKFGVEGVVIDVDYFDERKFAETAASKAKVGSELIHLTYSKHYVEDPDGQWQGYKDTDKDRAWGVTGWGRRAFLGSLFDWTMANAIIPAEDPDPTHVGLKKIDRTTVMEILEIASQARSIQKQYDNANNGLNPLGLVSDVVPFDINPARLNPQASNTATHFEQVFENALEAMENARAVFDHANEIKNHLREVTLSEQNFADQVIDEDREYRNKLIELFGTPYEGTIGPGKAYPPGYKGPDYYFHSYIDVNEVSEETMPQPSEDMMINFGPQNQLFIRQTGEDSGYNDLPAMFTQFFDADLEGSEYASTDFSGAVDITFPISVGHYSFQAPSDWGMRESPGEIQVALIELVKAEADLQLALAKYSGLMGEIYYKTKILQGRSDLNKSELDIAKKWKGQTESFLASIVTLRNTADASEVVGEFVKDSYNAAAESLPKMIGMSTDVNSPLRGALEASAALSSKISRGIALASRAAADGVETQKELAQFDIDMEIQKANYRYDIQQILAELEGLLGDEAPTRIAIFKQREHMRQVSEKYRALLSKGLRLLEERKVYNARVAKKAQGKRYMDMTFRLNLNQSLSKYRNAFDVAARYVYLAAKAYDYDTNLNDRDPASAKALLTDIVKQRHLGQFQNGQYVLGQGGLGDILATMQINYNVLKNQMGFNTPQTETGRFSLRSEFMRIKHDDNSDADFRDELKKKCVDDLWSVPEFRKYCRPFASKNLGEQPGLIISFGTKILFGKNYFGWPLSGGDHTYDPTNFATKVRSVGVWFEGYDNSQLSETPRVYLFPTGMDVMLVSNSIELDTREWTVVDQKLPIPLPIRGSDLNNPNWIPSLDSLDSSMIKIRRFSSFRAYHDSGYFDANQMSFESRLVGRSVWNTNWMLVIPGGIFHYDPEYGLEKFIESVKDIKLFFQTYAISGN
ncbi:conserved hypothetical protein, secreted [Candidatus Magnetomorum sp. HK-1]|nr:conserved hypothetical protein, secreted [Candidatus Magnetomorum sp. HK-1]